MIEALRHDNLRMRCAQARCDGFVQLKIKGRTLDFFNIAAGNLVCIGGRVMRCVQTQDMIFN